MVNLFEAKEELRIIRRNSSLEDKLHELLKLQRIYIEIVSTRRPLTELERVWDIDK